ncbi:MAG: hypothetical protein IJ084_01850 [Prevotella sp.]|nr:hypothetical protein [Prevotella sp.]
MKKLSWMLATIFSCGLMLTACLPNYTAVADDDDVIKPETPVVKDLTKPETPVEKDFTIIYYGNGGGNLDASILWNMCQMYEADESSYDKVNIVVQYKHSQNIKNEAKYVDFIETQAIPGFEFEKGTTYRFAVDPEKYYSEKSPQMQFTDDNIYGGKGNKVDIGQADTLCNYIKWAVKNYPAKQYVLVFSDHGGGYMPNDDLPESLTKSTTASTRGIVYDDGYKSDYGDSHLSLIGLTRAIREAGIKPAFIYFDACLMNNLEYMFELKDLTSYIMASTYLTPGAGGTYAPFINALAKKGATPEAFEQYYVALRKYWSDNDPTIAGYHDNSVTRTDRLDAVGTTLRTFVDCLTDVYQNGDTEVRNEIDLITAKVYKVASSNPYYDMENFLAYMANEKQVSNTKLNAAADAALEAIGNANVAYTGTQYTYNNYVPGPSVLMAQEGFYSYLYYEEDATGKNVLTGKKVYSWDGTTSTYTWDNTNQKFVDDDQDGTWGSTGANTYEKLKFDQATGWSRWLKLNKQEPNLVSPTTNNENWDESYIYFQWH